MIGNFSKETVTTTKDALLGFTCNFSIIFGFFSDILFSTLSASGQPQKPVCFQSAHGQNFSYLGSRKIFFTEFRKSIELV